MRVYRGFEHRFSKAVVVVGSFDGVHRGHRQLIALLNEQADARAGDAVVVTFDPHPRSVLKKENRLLSTIDERLILLESAGVRNVVVVEFTLDFASIDASEFVDSYLVGKLGAELVFTGSGHTFGRNRGGDGHFLQGCKVESRYVERFDQISSTLVRAAVEGGDMELATSLLGSNYLIVTPVVEPSKLLPREGAYICDVEGYEVQLNIAQIRGMDTKKRVWVKKAL